MLYTGKYAAGLVAEVAARGGVLTAADLAAAQPVVRQPLRASAMGVDLLTAPPPSSGATVLTALMVLAGGQGGRGWMRASGRAGGCLQCWLGMGVSVGVAACADGAGRWAGWVGGRRCRCI